MEEEEEEPQWWWDHPLMVAVGSVGTYVMLVALAETLWRLPQVVVALLWWWLS